MCHHATGHLSEIDLTRTNKDSQSYQTVWHSPMQKSAGSDRCVAQTNYQSSFSAGGTTIPADPSQGTGLCRRLHNSSPMSRIKEDSHIREGVSGACRRGTVIFAWQTQSIVSCQQRIPGQTASHVIYSRNRLDADQP